MKTIKTFSVSPAAYDDVQALVSELGLKDVNIVSEPSSVVDASHQVVSLTEQSELSSSELFKEVEVRLLSLSEAVSSLKKKL